MTTLLIIFAAVYVGATLVLVRLAWRLGHRAIWLMEDAQRSLSPRDGGVPKNIRAPRSRWFVQWFEKAPPGLHFHVKRTRRSEIEHTLSAPYIVKWKSWELVAVAFGRILAIYRWTEQWAGE